MADHKRKLPWLNPGDRLVLVIASVLVLALLGAHHALRAGLGKPPPQFRAGAIKSHLVDINKAEWWELQALFGIGEKRAEDIVEYRRTNGAFKSVKDLTDVSGIGKKTVDGLSEHLTAGEREESK